MPIGFYRYICDPAEVNQAMNERKLHSMNRITGHATWYAPTRYEKPAEAQRELALRRPPTHRVGPIPANEMPDFDIGFRTVAPANGQPGGGVEVCTRSPVWLFGLWNFQTSKYEM